MKCYILRWNPNISSYKQENHREFYNCLMNGLPFPTLNWSIYDWEDVEVGDVFILQQVGTENDGIAMIGTFSSGIYEDDSWKKDGTKIHYADLEPVSIFDRTTDCKILPAFQLEKEFPEIDWHKGHSGELVNQLVGDKLFARITEELIARDIWTEDFPEEYFSIPTIVFDNEDEAEIKIPESQPILQLRKNTSVPFPEKLKEGYRWNHKTIIGNIDADKIEIALQSFVASHNDEPVFFILELPKRLDDENEIAPGILEESPNDVYFVDDLDTESAFAVWNMVKDIIMNDGMCEFGFGCHNSNDEFFITKYNEFHFSCYNPIMAKTFMQFLKIILNNKLILAGETLSQEQPGMVEAGEYKGKDIYDIPELLKDAGMYQAGLYE